MTAGPAVTAITTLEIAHVMGIRSGDSGLALSNTRAWMTRTYQRDLRSSESIRTAYRQHSGPEGFIAHLAGILRTQGWIFEPVDVWDSPRGRVLIDGHHRVFASQDAGLPSVPAMIRGGYTWEGATFDELLGRC
ncbi:hypothetical protein BKG82_26225 [Mycobacteroides chelonae]|uniref:ParB-like N-terminal domain-containing protein n=1 Tax=Mycobacteroides chelonae TaxID=1774 RepID=A0A1S1LHH8_MYCCH|nr:ParB/Srx family N-terminal domain-containing protein [Mycobacteroides chelonae]OHU47157.1 hypothetical protein BKG82_26225 [Mycobacteroides chelonae]